MMDMRQLALPFARGSHFTDAGFLRAPSNHDALAWIDRDSAWPLGRLALWGTAGCGKTHLLHIWAQRVGADLLTLQELPSTPPARPLALDDADLAPELALLHILNAAVEAGLPVLLAARRPPSRWNVGLPDLASRLRATSAVEIRPPEDGLLRALLASQLAERQLRVDETVQAWMLLRLARTPAAIREAAARLDHASLATSGRFTQRQAAQVLAGLADTIGSDDPSSHHHQTVLRIDEHTAAFEPGLF